MESQEVLGSKPGEFCFVVVPESLKLEPEEGENLANKDEHQGSSSQFVLPEVNESHECSLCEKSYKSLDSLKRHIRIKHEPARVYKPEHTEKCQLCGEEVSCTMAAHLFRFHPSDASRCNFCTDVFSSQAQLDEHVAGHAADLLCSFCVFRTASRQSMVSHMVRYHVPRRVKCPECPMLVTKSSALKRHIWWMHAKFTCPHCSIEILNRTKNRHLKIEKCPVCRIEFPCVRSLREHKATGCERAVRCTICKVTFQSNGELSRHVALAHGVGQVEEIVVPPVLKVARTYARKLPVKSQATPIEQIFIKKEVESELN